MAKLRRSQLKSIVKECLVEILAEGLSTVNLTEASTKNTKSAVRPRPQLQTEETKQFKTAVNSTVGALTSDPLMAEIFRDTAETTLQEQLGAETTPQVAGLQAPAGPSVDVEDFFGESAKNWAALAFSDTKKNKPL